MSKHNENKNYYPYLSQGVLIGKRYRIGKIMATDILYSVYKGSDQNEKKRITIKEFFSVGASRIGDTVVFTDSDHDFNGIKKCFLKEVLVLKKVENPNIIKVHDFVEENNSVYAIMEYLEGETLQKIIRLKGCITKTNFLKYAIDLLNGLKGLHESGILHRDINTKNILLSDGKVKLIGLQIGDENLNSIRFDKTGINLFAFTAPELYNSQKIIGPELDIYALGVVLHEMITGKTPPSVYNRLSNNEPFTDLKSIEIDSVIKNIIKKCLSINIKDRFRSVAELERAFDF